MKKKLEQRIKIYANNWEKGSKSMKLIEKKD